MNRVDGVKLDDFDLHELEALQGRVAKAIAARREDVKRALREKMEALAAQEGLTLAEVVATRTKKTRAKARAKYANPKNPSEVWSGRGRQPVWVRDALARGMTLAQLAI